MNKIAIQEELKALKIRHKSDEARIKELQAMLVDDCYATDNFELKFFIFCKGSIKVVASPKQIKALHPKWYKAMLEDGSLKETVSGDYLKLK